MRARPVATDRKNRTTACFQPHHGKIIGGAGAQLLGFRAMPATQKPGIETGLSLRIGHGRAKRVLPGGYQRHLHARQGQGRGVGTRGNGKPVAAACDGKPDIAEADPMDRKRRGGIGRVFISLSRRAGRPGCGGIFSRDEIEAILLAMGDGAKRKTRAPGAVFLPTRLQRALPDFGQPVGKQELEGAPVHCRLRHVDIGTATHARDLRQALGQVIDMHAHHRHVDGLDNDIARNLLRENISIPTERHHGRAIAKMGRERQRARQHFLCGGTETGGYGDMIGGIVGKPAKAEVVILHTRDKMHRGRKRDIRGQAIRSGRIERPVENQADFRMLTARVDLGPGEGEGRGIIGRPCHPIRQWHGRGQ